jgi:hypothetical protein
MTAVANGTAVLNVVGDRVRVIVEGSATEDTFEMFDAEGDEGSGPPPHAHPCRVASPWARFLTTTSGGRAWAFFRDLALTAPGVPSDASMPLVVEVAKRHGLTSPVFD